MPGCARTIRASTSKDPLMFTISPQGIRIVDWASRKAAIKNSPTAAPKSKRKVSLAMGRRVAACTDPVYGDVVLAEYTLPFNEADVTYYRPLFQRTVVAANQLPTYVAADAAFDFWYVYETVAHGQGIAAVALNSHGHEDVPR